MPRRRKARVGLYVNDPCATTRRLVRCLEEWSLPYVTVPRAELAALKPGDVDVLLLHGGWYGIDRVPGQNQRDRIQTPQNKAMARAVRRFVREGGGIVGVCCGAFNIVWMDLIKADISRAQGVGMHALEVVDDQHPVAKGVIKRVKGRRDRKWEALPVIRINGPILFPRDAGSMVFSYDWERRLGAVLAGEYGGGRAVAISPHPERAEDDLAIGPDAGAEMGPLMPVAGVLKNALLWAAGGDNG